MMRVAYRVTPGSNRKRRPGFFTKGRALASLLAAVEQAPGVSVTFLCDGEMPPPIAMVLSHFGDVVHLAGAGNAGSYRAAVRWAMTNVGGDGAVYLCEDDYLHDPTALREIASAVAILGNGSYVTGYDHPDRYRRSDDRPLAPSPLDAVVAPRWRRVESTTMTFATTAATLRDDALVHRISAIRHYPRDRILWHTLQGLPPLGRVLRVRHPPRLLYGARPALASHIEDDQLALGRNWAAVAASAQAWAERYAAPLGGTW